MKTLPVSRDDVLHIHGDGFRGVEVTVGALLDALDVRAGGLILVLAGDRVVRKAWRR